MNNSKSKIFLILAKYKYSYIVLLFFVGVFLFPKTAYLSTITPEKIINLTNQERINKDLDPLTANQFLSQAAYNKARDIFKEQRFEHNFDDRRFSAWIRDVGYKYKYVGENLAIDFVSSEGVVNAWINSPSHYENLINDKFSEIGVAVVEDIFKNKRSIVVVQIFGSPLKNSLSLNSIKLKKSLDNNNINYLNNDKQDDLDLNIISNNKIFLISKTENKLNYIPTKKENRSIPDLFFTLIGFIYLGVFKLVSFKNIGL